MFRPPLNTNQPTWVCSWLFYCTRGLWCWSLCMHCTTFHVYIALVSVFPHDISKTDANLTKPPPDMVLHEFWKPIYFGSKVKRHKNITSQGHGTLVSAGF